ncbi:PIN domain-containing protein [Paracraurococcus lichenis]|uniref:PIN domain-containing protein n=1 Tax=Paracraurococcus lichenis TaxID=3064888 RepID=A0ABT9E4T5_9PROT|nr:PIN domain-containing protein [Paracraurococcus sp. LOR1-02]MDO9711184.1 PIN domain-containing protein [Paracraurococcus sp. LOR1-02]
MTSDPPAVALLDACVLFRGRVTDLLLHLAEARLFEPAWSPTIAAEWTRGLARRRGVTAVAIEARAALLDAAFPAAACTPDPALVEAVADRCRNAAQRKDAHVVAAALAAGARSIVTENTADMPPRLLTGFGLHALRPDEFCAGLLAAAPAKVRAALDRHRAGLPPPQDAPEGYRALLASRRLSLPRTAALLAAPPIPA